MPINETCHRAHPMPKNPTVDERIRWHEDHAERCGCRPIPEGLEKEIAQRMPQAYVQTSVGTTIRFG